MCLSISDLNKKIACVVGKVEGYISKEPKGKIGIFDVKNNKINHRLNFYKIDEGEIKEIF